MSDMRKVKPLRPGDKIALLGTSSAVPEKDFAPAVEAIRDLGLEPVIYESAHSRHGFLAATDEVRAADLNAAFADDSIAGIWSIRGGYGAARILPLLDFDMIAKHPKFFGGYSDVTGIHSAINRYCRFVTFHMTMPGALGTGVPPYSMRYVRDMLFGYENTVFENPAYMAKPYMLNPGKAEGELVGGNLALISSACGTPWDLDVKGKILFIEELNEYHYSVDGMFTQLRNAGKFDDCAGIILGDFKNIGAGEEDEDVKKGECHSLQQIIAETVLPSGKPVIAGVQCGHCTPTMCLPLGETFWLDADNASFGLKK